MIDTCIYAPYDQCFHDCPNCPRACEEEDADMVRDIYSEREWANG